MWKVWSASSTNTKNTSLEPKMKLKREKKHNIPSLYQDPAQVEISKITIILKRHNRVLINPKLAGVHLKPVIAQIDLPWPSIITSMEEAISVRPAISQIRVEDNFKTKNTIWSPMKIRKVQ